MPVYYIVRTDFSDGSRWVMDHLGLWTAKSDAEDFVAMKLAGGYWVDDVFTQNIGRYGFTIEEGWIAE